jgi:hypothetical protein
MEEPIHRWFRFKEGFSAKLLGWVNQNYFAVPKNEENLIRILDPFCGSGTTALSAQQLPEENIAVDAVEINPFISLLAQTKIEAYTHNRKELEELKFNLFSWVAKNSYQTIELPKLATFHNNNFFSDTVLKDLFLFRDAIQSVCLEDRQKRFMQVAWASILHQVSLLRKDGRALRYSPNRQIQDVASAIEHQLQVMIDDIQFANEPSVKSRIYLGSATNLSKVYTCSNNIRSNLRRNRYSICLYSPPYCNCMDYSEIYKLELWGLRFIQSDLEFRQLRLSTLCSHPSIKRSKDSYEISHDKRCENTWRDIQSLVDEKMDLSIDGNRRAHLPWLIKGYFNDMYISIKQQIDVLLPGGYIFIVVSGSKHGKLILQTDILLASILQDLGLVLIEILVGRTYWRRLGSIDNVRESIIVAKKTLY